MCKPHKVNGADKRTVQDKRQDVHDKVVANVER